MAPNNGAWAVLPDVRVRGRRRVRRDEHRHRSRRSAERIADRLPNGARRGVARARSLRPAGGPRRDRRRRCSGSRRRTERAATPASDRRSRRPTAPGRIRRARRTSTGRRRRRSARFSSAPTCFGLGDDRERAAGSSSSISSPIFTHSPCFDSVLSSVWRSPQPCSSSTRGTRASSRRTRSAAARPCSRSLDLRPRSCPVTTNSGPEISNDGARPPGLREAALDRGHRHLLHVPLGREAVDDDAVGDLAARPRSSARRPRRGTPSARRTGSGRGAKNGVINVCVVELAAEVELRRRRSTTPRSPASRGCTRACARPGATTASRTASRCAA